MLSASKLLGPTLLHTTMHITIAVLVFFSTVRAASSPDGFLHLPLGRFATPAVERGLMRRTDDLDISLRYNRTYYSYYSIELELGTPPQRVSLALDTDSDKVFVLNDAACRRIDCAQESVFDPNTSSSFRTNDTYFSETYNNGDAARGQWAQDTLRLGGQEITDFNVAVADLSGALSSVAGIGIDVESTQNVSLPQQLKQKGIIQQAAYSLWLSRDDANASSILFGAIDHAKFSSDLYRVPLVKIGNMAVHMTGLSTYDGCGNEQPFATCDMPVVLDPRSVYSYLPFDIIQPLYAILPLLEHHEDFYSDLHVVPCDILSSRDGGVGIHIGGIDLTVGFSELFVKVGASNDDGTEYCVPGFLNVENLRELGYENVLPILGNNVLKSFYVVYDLENLEVGFAAAHTEIIESSSSIQPLSTGIPGKRAAKPPNNSRFVDSNYGVAPITLIAPAATRPTAVTITSSIFTAVETSVGDTVATSRTVPSSVTETIMIGAKHDAGDTATVLGSTAAEKTSSRGTSSAEISDSAMSVGSSFAEATSRSSTTDDRQQASSNDGTSHVTSQPTEASSAGGQAQSYKQAATDGASTARSTSFLTALAGLVSAML